MAVVEYSHPIEAVQAISMLHNQRLYDRTISVKMDRFDKEANRRDGELPQGLRSVGMGLGANGAPLADVASVLATLAPQASANGNSAFAVNPFVPAVQPVAVQQPFIQQPIIQQQQQQPIASYPTSALSGAFASPQVQQPQQHFGAYSQQQQQEQSPAQTTPVYYQQPQSIPQQQAQPAPQPVPAPSQYSSAQQYVAKSTPAPTGGYSAPQTALGTGHLRESGFGVKHDSVIGGSSSGFGLGGGGGSSYDQVPSRIILIKNLPLDYTWQIVSDRVQQFGELESVEMVSAGVAKVRFIQLSEAERAKATLQGTTVEGRVIGIEYL